jgi:hypothetical protein
VTTSPFPGNREPDAEPEPVSPAERAAFDALVSASLPAVRSSAQAWRTGLAALITLITAGIVVQGRSTTMELEPNWRLAITLLIGGGLFAAATGLWQALAAEAGTRLQTLTLAEIHQRHGSVAAYQVALASTAGRHLGQARNAVSTALPLLFAGIVCTWWAPAAPAKPPAFLRVAHQQETICGVLTSADGGQLRLTMPCAHQPVIIPLADVENITIVPACP